ncbi:MAG TPA: hypothetical protein PKL31_04235 [Fulvivirga sp.]|nr:hypothetical protein [Fulvivirga sp.]
MKLEFKHIVIFLLIGFCVPTYGQRIEIDRLERDFKGSFRDREAYELSQKFIQIDSTYYTGYYFEGIYRYLRASDQLGYQTAIKPLRKALYLMDKDYKRELQRTTNIGSYINVYQLQRKYVVLVDLLARSNQYVGQPEKSLVVLRKLIDKDFVFNFGAEPYATMAWIYHRNRIYSPEKYSFLKNSIEENVHLASKFADSILIVNKKNRQFINQWFSNFKDDANGSYFHYKNLIYSYLVKVDSAEYCAKQLMKIDHLSKNNYGNLQFIQGKFEKAEEYYNLAREEDGYQTKDTKEFDYMQSVINIFKNDIKTATSLIGNSMDMLGQTPGYGWNNIALSRVYYYAGDLEASKKYRDKAANFKELHINSTWGKLHYDRNTLLLDYLYNYRKIDEIKFSDKYYWLNIKKLSDIAKYYFKQENDHMLLTSDLSANPERFLVLYNIFSSENTIFFDEIWSIIRTFNPNYFIRIFEDKMKQDSREGILKYYQYFIAKFQLEDGNYQQAVTSFNKILADKTLDQTYEKLLMARAYEGLSIAFGELDKSKEATENLLKFYNTYPQLVPFSPLKMKFKLHIENRNLSEDQQTIIDAVKRHNIDWVDENESSPIIVSINFAMDEGKKVLNYQVRDHLEQKFEGSIEYKAVENPGQQLVYSLFNITKHKIE